MIIDVREILSEEILGRSGHLLHVRKYLRGYRPDEFAGRIHQGWSGIETVVEETVIETVRVFKVLPLLDSDGTR